VRALVVEDAIKASDLAFQRLGRFFLPGQRYSLMRAVLPRMGQAGSVRSQSPGAATGSLLKLKTAWVEANEAPLSPRMLDGRRLFFE
jgi:hypothetical protein